VAIGRLHLHESHLAAMRRGFGFGFALLLVSDGLIEVGGGKFLDIVSGLANVASVFHEYFTA